MFERFRTKTNLKLSVNFFQLPYTNTFEILYRFMFKVLHLLFLKKYNQLLRTFEKLYKLLQKLLCYNFCNPPPLSSVVLNTHILGLFSSIYSQVCFQRSMSTHVIHTLTIPTLLS